MFPRPDFFAGARLNFAENLLFPANVEVDEKATAVITATEDESQLSETSWAELRDQVRRSLQRLASRGRLRRIALWPALWPTMCRHWLSY
jgi:Acyl-coenzyme A synthetases/AMP-(fatty) acid ligases